MTPLQLGFYGGMISFLSTATGSVGALFSREKGKAGGTNRFSLSIDFALGIMVAASAFSLIAPAAIDARSRGHSVFSILGWTALGAFAVYLLKLFMDHLQTENPDGSSKITSSRFLLAAVLMLHNFPEGLASGAAVAGLGWKASAGILSAIALQNLPEGALMVFCLSAMGWKTRNAFLGGIASGGVELVGGIFAGILLGVTHDLLPSLLAIAGGAMMASVWIELRETEGRFWDRILSHPFQGGFLFLSAFQLLQLTNFQ